MQPIEAVEREVDRLQYNKLIMKKIFCILFCLSVPILPTLAQDGSCMEARTYTKNNLAFQAGERLTIVATYKWGLVNMDVGEATLTLQEESFRDTQYFFGRGIAKTYKFWDKFFKVRDIYEGRFLVNSLRPIYFHRDIKEGSYKMRNTYIFDQETNMISATIQSNNNPERKYELQGKPCTFDIISLFYNSRNLDFADVTPGKTFPISFAIDEQVYDLYYRYLGRENIKVGKIGTFRCLKFAAKLIAGEVFTGKEELIIWITDDRNRIPMLIETPVSVGRVTARISEYANLKYPLTSKVE